MKPDMTPQTIDKLLWVEVQEIWVAGSKLDHGKNKNTMINYHKHQSCMHAFMMACYPVGALGQEA